MVAAGKKAAAARATGAYTFEQHLAGKPDAMRQLAVSVNDFITGLDPAIEVSPKKFYVAYKTSQNIVCMEVKQQRVLLYLKLDPKVARGPKGISRDVTEVGHYGTGDLDLFGSRGPLSTFASRTDLGYALGLFHDSVYHDLKLIRRVRNDFAHNFDDATFDLPAVRDRCADLWFIKQLATHQDVEALSGRDRFLLSVGHATLAMTQPLHRHWIDSSPNRRMQP